MIKPIMTQPCKSCPFKLDTLKGWLGQDRTLSISKSLLNGESFPCHKTFAGKFKHCAGAALILELMNQPNQLMQVAQRLNHYPKPLRGKDLVFQTFDSFIKYHS